MNFEMLLFVASSAIILPVVAVFTIAFFTGGLKDTENAKFLATDESEYDYWTQTGRNAGVGSASLARPNAVAIPREGE